MCDHAARSTAFILSCVLCAGGGDGSDHKPISGVVTVSGVRTETPSVSVTTHSPAQPSPAQPSPAQRYTHRAKVETKEKQVPLLAQPSPAQPRLAASAVLEWRSTKKASV